jgi:hypothetical protein
VRNHTSDTFTDCIEACSTSWADDVPACRAVTFDYEKKRCQQKDGNTTTANFVYATNNATALNFSSQFDYDASKDICPGANGTIKTDVNGYRYQILCGTFWSAGDSFDPNKSNESEYTAFHATTIEECLKYCSSKSPLCYGVRYTDDPRLSYHNCFAKRANGTLPLTNGESKLQPNTVHTVALGLFQVNSTCTQAAYTANISAILEPKCDSSADGPSLKQVHADNFEQCMDSCASYKDPQDVGNTECRGVLYQSNAESGFLNCYLKYALSNVTAKAEWHVATVEGPAAQKANSGGGGSNSAVIGGAVGGAVGGVALLAGLAFWYRRSMKKARRSHGLDGKDMVESKPFSPNGAGVSPPPGYKSTVATPAEMAASSQRPLPPAMELDGRAHGGTAAPRHELQ